MSLYLSFSITVDAKKESKSYSGINGTQCHDGMSKECPGDTCNFGSCDDGCYSLGCTEMACDEHNKDENQICVLKLNNCKDGLKCVDQDDGCDNGVGRCIKTGKLTKRNSAKTAHFWISICKNLF